MSFKEFSKIDIFRLVLTFFIFFFGYGALFIWIGWTKVYSWIIVALLALAMSAVQYFRMKAEYKKLRDQLKRDLGEEAEL